MYSPAPQIQQGLRRVRLSRVRFDGLIELEDLFRLEEVRGESGEVVLGIGGYRRGEFLGVGLVLGPVGLRLGLLRVVVRGGVVGGDTWRGEVANALEGWARAVG